MKILQLKNTWQLASALPLSLFFSLFFSLLLTACGGGGSDDNRAQANVPQVADDSLHQVNPTCAAGSAYTLMVKGSNGVNPKQLETMLCTFFEVYPKIVQRLNPNAPKTVNWVFEAKLEVPAYTLGTTISYSKDYLAGHVLDSDIAVHELTHVVQGGVTNTLPGWIIEGTADVIRDVYGLHNKENGWTLPTAYNPGHSYLSGYGDAAAFLKWIDANYRQNQSSTINALIDAVANGGVYSDQVWLKLAGKDLDTLWFLYSGQKAPPPFTTGVTLYEDANFGGKAIMLEKGRYDLDDLLARGVSNDSISSIKVPAGYKVTVYTDFHFSGGSMAYGSDTANMLSPYDNNTSSIIVE